MILAIPVQNEMMTERIFLSEAYTFVDIDPKTQEITASESRGAPPLAPEYLPDWLVKMGATVVIARGMTSRLQSLCEYHGLRVVLGVEPAKPEHLARAFVSGELPSA